jgi:hypothetical protein
LDASHLGATLHRRMLGEVSGTEGTQ